MVGRSNRSAYRIIYYLNIYIFVINIVTNPIFCKPEHTYIYYVIHHLYQTTFISFWTNQSVLIIITPIINLNTDKLHMNHALLHLDTYYFSCREYRFVSVRYIMRIQRVLYLDWYILKYYCSTLSSRASCICIRYTLRIQRVLYLDWYRLTYYYRTLSSRASCIWTIHTENTEREWRERVVSGLIQTKVFLFLSFLYQLYG